MQIEGHGPLAHLFVQDGEDVGTASNGEEVEVLDLGIEPVDHDEFNPELHQAIQHVESKEHEEGAIVDVYQKGYKLKNKLIRPSMVTINKKS